MKHSDARGPRLWSSCPASSAGEIISCLEEADALQSVDLNELSVTLDIFVLTLPLEIEVMTDVHHNRLVEAQ